MFVATPSSVGCDDGSVTTKEVQIHRAARVVWTRLQPPPDLEVRLHMVWVSGEGAAAQRSPGIGTPPAQLKARMCRLVQNHLHLQCVRITGIPMKDGVAGAPTRDADKVFAQVSHARDECRSSRIPCFLQSSKHAFFFTTRSYSGCLYVLPFANVVASHSQTLCVFEGMCLPRIAVRG